jgi:hypothetical protein
VALYHDISRSAAASRQAERFFEIIKKKWEHSTAFQGETGAKGAKFIKGAGFFRFFAFRAGEEGGNSTPDTV